MTADQLTKLLASRYTEDQIEAQFLARYPERVVVKQRFRKANVVTALVIGLIWARENVQRGEWGIALAKIGGVGLSAVLINRLLLARDPAAATIMAKKVGNFGRWFQGLARANPAVTRFTRFLMVTEVAKISLSGGGEYPSIPWDIIIDIDLDDSKTWRPPNSTLLNLGFNIWYRQSCTPQYPEACGGNFYLGRVEGSILTGIGRGIMAVSEAVSGMD